MTLETKTALDATIATNLPDNTTKSIAPSGHRTVHTNIADGVWGLVHTTIDDTDSPYTVDLDATQVLLADPSSGAITVDLPAVATSSGRWLVVKNTGTTNAVTLDGNASEEIDGSATYALSSQYDVVKVFCDGTSWWVLST